MYEDLRIICWPDPRLKKKSKPVDVFDAALQALARRMFVLVREAKGVGLAAPQVGMNVRMFVMNPTGQDGDDRIYVNPVLCDPVGEEESEEGCLSLPGIHVNVVRNKAIHISAQDLDGQTIEQTETGYIARIWQHEYDHLNGALLTDRMSPAARMTNRKLLKEMEEHYAAEHPPLPMKKRVGAK